MSDVPAGIETLDFSFAGERPAGAFAPVLVGVVGSGNLEVLLEAAAGTDCAVHVETSARGFGPIWQAVMSDFHAAPSAGRRARLDQRHGRHARGGQPAARPGRGRAHRSDDHDQLCRMLGARAAGAARSTPAAFTNGCRRPSA